MDKSIFDTFHPTGFSSVNAYLFVSDAPAYIEFLKNGLLGQEIGRTINPDTGDIANAIIEIGASRIMISEARQEFLGMRTSFYLYVNNVDELHANAVRSGASSVLEPADMSYGDRQSGIQDKAGNYWWISKRLENKDYE